MNYSAPTYLSSAYCGPRTVPGAGSVAKSRARHSSHGAYILIVNKQVSKMTSAGDKFHTARWMFSAGSRFLLGDSRTPLSTELRMRKAMWP